jgi:isopenicillin-N N-acyltransferase like protein
VKIHTFASETSDPATRGRQTGERWAREIRETAARYLDFFPRVGIGAETARAIGEASLSRLDAWCPDLAAEVVAMAEGAGLAPWRLACLNARTEILAVRPPVSEGECSTAVHVPAVAGAPRAPRSIQTWDWHGMLAPEGLMHRLTTRRGVTVKLFTEFGVLGKIGVNSLGLGLHFNILRHASDNGAGGVPVHAIARRVLEEAASVEEAVDLARSATLSASTVLTVFTRDAAGLRAACIELSPSGVAVVPPREDGWVLHTNHFLDADLSRDERAPAASTSWARLAHLQAAVAGMTAGDLQSRAAEMCGGRGAAAPVCVHANPDLPDTERIETLLTVGIDTEACALDYAPGHPANLATAGSARF